MRMKLKLVDETPNYIEKESSKLILTDFLPLYGIYDYVKRNLPLKEGESFNLSNLLILGVYNAGFVVSFVRGIESLLK